MIRSFPSGTLRLGTRASTLARWQTQAVRQRLASLHSDLSCKEVVLRTQGDQDVSTPLPVMGGRGVFTDALEQALLDGRIDLAVHSLKDVPVDPTPGLTLVALCLREDPRDAMVSARGYTLATLPQGGVVGTCSLRRSAQLLALRPDLQLAPLRGNVDTRVRHAAEGKFAAIVLAAAGLKRLGLASQISELIDPGLILPAPGQGALAIQCRAEDARTLALVSPLDDPAVRQETEAERAFLAGLGGGCAAPIAALGRVDGPQLRLVGLVASEDGRQLLHLEGTAPRAEAVTLGHDLARQAVHRGAGALLI